jgi:magnesium transporter
MRPEEPTAAVQAMALAGLDVSRHPVESAAEHVVTNVPTARESERVDEVLARLPQRTFDSVDAVYVVGPDGTWKGAVRLSDLLRAPSRARMEELVDDRYPHVRPHHDQEHVVAEALERRATTVAVVDDAERLVGVIPALSLLDILRQEHVEDLHRLAGIQRETARSRSALEEPPARRARHRILWLLVGLAGSMVAAGVVSRFERVLESQLAVAFFVPTIVYLADAIGTQTEAIVVRGLSLSRLSLRQLLFSELRTGLLIGVTLGVLAFPVVAASSRDVRLGVSVAAAILVAGAVATTIGLLLPWLLQRMGTDPAFGSGPVATILQDVLSLLIYLAIASALLT